LKKVGTRKRDDATAASFGKRKQGRWLCRPNARGKEEEVGQRRKSERSRIAAFVCGGRDGKKDTLPGRGFSKCVRKKKLKDFGGGGKGLSEAERGFSVQAGERTEEGPTVAGIKIRIGEGGIKKPRGIGCSRKRDWESEIL